MSRHAPDQAFVRDVVLRFRRALDAAGLAEGFHDAVRGTSPARVEKLVGELIAGHVETVLESEPGTEETVTLVVHDSFDAAAVELARKVIGARPQ